MKFTSLLLGSISLFSLSSCLDDLNNPFTEETATETVTEPFTETSTSTNTQIEVCDLIESNIDFTFNVDSQSQLATFDASQSLYSTCENSSPFETYTWNFGDGTIITSNKSSASHHYLLPNQYSVTLTASIDEFELSTSREVLVNNEPNVCIALASHSHFSYSNDYLGNVMFDASSSYIFDNCSYQPISEYLWDFGDGQTFSTSNNMVSHNFAEASDYYVSLTVSNENSSYTYSNIINVGQTSSALWEECVDTAFVDVKSHETPVSFNVMFGPAQCDELPIQYTWQTGDGTEVFGNNASYAYTQAGNYPALLMMSLPSESLIHVVDFNIVIEGSQACEQILDINNIETYVYDMSATFDASNLFGFGCNNQYLEDEYTWDFGDGTTLVTSAPFISHTYTHNNNYNVTVTNSDNLTASAYATIEYNYFCTDDYPTSSCSTPSHLLSIQAQSTDSFNDHTYFNLSDRSLQSELNSYSWTSSNGQTATSNYFNMHFSEAGVYEVMLKAHLPNAEDLVLVVQYEVSSVSCNEPVYLTETETETDTETSTNISLEVELDLPLGAVPIEMPDNNIEVVFNSESGLNVDFEMLWSSESPCQTYVWDFGDGYLLETSDFEVEHEYLNAGTYEIKVWDGFNNGYIQISVSHSNTCDIPEVADFTFYTNSNTAHFDASTSSNLCADIIYVWDFGVGGIVETSSPYISHTYEANTYTDAYLTIKGTDSYMYKYIPINPVLLEIEHSYVQDELAFNFTAFASVLNPELIVDIGYELLIPENVEPLAPPVEAFSYHWDFGDGSTSDGEIVSHSYQSEGYYTVTIVATNYYTQEAVTKLFNVSAFFDPEPIEINVDIQTQIYGSGVYFNAITTTNIQPGQQDLLYNWDFGDGIRHSFYNITEEYHTYTDAGSYTVTLTIIDSNSGATTVEEVTIVITE
ncbi:MAG: PKD domain-containing protein [Saccharospirillaceae bacterium]|nr:PKD domain-containing protein [Pseudomonadales bacterium]NRB81833.1 PKD domain-containing protein [Saccharospirillaceae bacterium]